MKLIKNLKIAIIGLGYVGLPLATAFSSKFKVIGYDKDKSRIRELQKFKDRTNEVEKKKLLRFKKNLKYTNTFNDIKKCNFFILTVPTPITKKNRPDLESIINVAKKLALIISKGSFIVLESTVYPGVTENILGKIIEKKSKLKINKDFYLGYSPERINPGDKIHTIENITKVVSASNKYSEKIIYNVYKKIIAKGIFLAKNIKTAEAAKVIENTQRDLNIAFMNELLIIFNKMRIDFFDVIEAAKTKWNFIDFSPGLVGGHCIGVDPYYLTYASKKVGINPKIILSGRYTNNYMTEYISRLVLKKTSSMLNPRILVLGYTFKENVPDIRNTKINQLCTLLSKNRNFKIYLNDPFILELPKNLKMKKNIFLIKKPKKNYFDIILFLVPHSNYLKMGLKNIRKFGRKNSSIIDLKGKICGKFLHQN